MAAKLGNKRQCPSCKVRYYDIGKKPPVCPKCGHVYAAREKKNTAPKPAKPPKPVEEKSKTLPEKAEATSTSHLDETNDDIDLSGFDEAKNMGGLSDIEAVEEVDEEEIQSLEELDDREREEDVKNSDDGDDEAFVEHMSGGKTLVDKPEETLEQEEGEELKKSAEAS